MRQHVFCREQSTVWTWNQLLFADQKVQSQLFVNKNMLTTGQSPFETSPLLNGFATEYPPIPVLYAAMY